MSRSHNRTVLISLVGILAFAGLMIFRPVRAGARGARTSSQFAQKRRIGQIPTLAKPEAFLGYTLPTEPMRLLLSFELRDEAGMQQLTEDLYNPNSPSYHQWLTPEDFGNRFGRTPEEFDAAVKWLQKQGFQVDRTYSNRLAIGFTGTPDVVQSAFQVQMGTYWDSARAKPFYSNMNAPTLPSFIDSMAVGLDGLNNAVTYHAHASATAAATLKGLKQQQSGAKGGTIQPQGKVGSSLFLLPKDLALLYDYQPLWNQNIKGAGQKVGVIIDSDIKDSDMTTFRTDAGLPALTVTRVVLQGLSNPGITGDEIEADLDTQSISAVAPAAEIDLVLVPQLDNSILTAEQDIVNQNTIKVVNESFGGCESTNFSTGEQQIFAQAVMQGIAFFASSGDEGADCDPQHFSTATIECPACFGGVTAVGGTAVTAAFDSSGNVTSRTSEVVWNDSPGTRFSCTGASEPGGASGGGIGATSPIPTYQSSSQGFTGGVPASTHRVVPDLAAIAKPGPVGALLVSEGSLFYGGGTSQSSPLLAGMMALINQFKGSAQGSPNTVLYQLGVNQYKNGGPHAFLDITSGNNNVAAVAGCPAVQGFSAGTGFDAVTGWGVPDLNIIATNYGGSTPPPPNYTGFVDHAGCDTISGWAADTNRLNTSINVEIYDGTTLVTTILASNSRPDVGTALGDNGLHGFSVATPAVFKNGSAHTVHVKFETSSTELTNSPASLTCSTSQPPNYIGFVDHIACDTITGWAADRNRLNTSINVEIYDGTTLLTTVVASNSRPDVGSFLGDNGLHGFSVATPAALKNGSAHTVHVKFETSTTELTNSPTSLTCSSGTVNYVGFADHIGCDNIRGWAADRNRLNTAINVEIYDGTTLITSILANASRPDVGSFLGDNGLHGFSVATPASLKNGALHSVHVKFETSTTELTNSPTNINCTSLPPNYVGFVDVAGCSGISGWAADRNRLNVSINVELYDGTTLVATTTANASRPDVGSFLGDNGLHGYTFSFPASLKDGHAHTLHIKYETSTTELTNSPTAALTCP